MHAVRAVHIYELYYVRGSGEGERESSKINMVLKLLEHNAADVNILRRYGTAPCRCLGAAQDVEAASALLLHCSLSEHLPLALRLNVAYRMPLAMSQRRSALQAVL